MGFRINSLGGLVVTKRLQLTQNSLQSSMEKLSSGLRINRGADDAAGLTISEKLRAQIRGLNRAIMNAQDGVSLIQTAEGALSESAFILNRVRELAVQASNDALTSNDRVEIQKEVDQLIDEVDRIATTTEFNTKKLLDGSASALVSTDYASFRGFHTGGVPAQAGSYKVELDKSSAGLKQELASHIFTLKNGGEIASRDTRLFALSQFHDNSGNFILENPQSLSISGNSRKSAVMLNGNMTLGDLEQALKSAISAEDGLHVIGQELSFAQNSAQLFLRSGIEGERGDLFFSGDEDLLKALGFQQLVASENPAFKVMVRGPDGQLQSQLAGVDGFSGPSGLNFLYEAPESAYLNTVNEAVDVLRTGNQEISFTFAGTRSNPDEEFSPTHYVQVTLRANSSYSMSSIADIINSNIQTGVDMVTGESFFDADCYTSYRPPDVTAEVKNGRLVLSSGYGGEFAKISIYNVSDGARNILGMEEMVYYGSGQADDPYVNGLELLLDDGFANDLMGWNPSDPATASVVGEELIVSSAASLQVVRSNSTFDYVGREMTFSADMSHNGAGPPPARNARLGIQKGSDGAPDDPLAYLQINGSTHPLANTAALMIKYKDASGQERTEAKLVSIANGDGVHNAKIQLRDDGRVEFYVDDTLLYTSENELTPDYEGQAAVALGSRGISSYDNVLIRGNPRNYEGQPAIADFAFNDSHRDYGYVFDSTTAFTLTDSNGRSTKDVVLGAKVSMGILLATENNVAISRSSVADILETAGILRTDLRYDFDRAGRLYFYTASAGEDSRIHLEAQNPLTGEPGETLLLDENSSRSSFFNAFGISADSMASGYGRSEFMVHVQERSLNFQIGANQNQAVKIAIACANSEALGLKNLDVTSHEAVVRALGRVDEAAGRISSMRSGLGAMQNRLTSTMNNLNVTSINLQDTESKIRDVDIAKETVNLALQQMLQQSGLAQLMNVKAINRNILSLLEG